MDDGNCGRGCSVVMVAVVVVLCEVVAAAVVVDGQRLYNSQSVLGNSPLLPATHKGSIAQ